VVESDRPDLKSTSAQKFRTFSLFLVPVLSFVLYYVLPRGSFNEQGELIAGLSDQGRATLAVTFLMGMWWLTEALPISATALIPLVLFPLLSIKSTAATAAPYAHRLIFLFMGGFMMAMAMQRWNLHRRIALNVIALIGTTPSRLILGFMVATAFLSMFVSNTSVAVMMFPIALSVLELILPQYDDKKIGGNFSICLCLGVAYAASIGGMGTLIGTPPNALFAAFFEDHYQKTISFSSWLLVGLPFVLLFLPLAWFVLCKIIFPLRMKEAKAGKEFIQDEITKLGPMKVEEKKVCVVFVVVASLWVFRKFLSSLFPNTLISNLDDTMIAMAGAMALFILPSQKGSGERLLNWDWAKRIPWGILILFGGGLSMASGIKDAGVAQYLGHLLKDLSGSMPLILLVLSVTIVVNFFTEIASNTATVAVFLPILAATSESLQIHPFYITVPAVLAASCAFMMPVATPPNAIVFSSGKVTIAQMAKTGICLNIVTSILIALISFGAVRFLID